MVRRRVLCYNTLMDSEKCHEQFNEIMHLSSLLPGEVGEAFTFRAALELRKGGDDVQMNLQRIKTELRNLVPDYEVMTFENFASPEEVDAETIGNTTIHFGDNQLLAIPEGTRIQKKEGMRCMDLVDINFGNGFHASFNAANFPKNGIRIKPMSSEAETEEEDEWQVR